MPHEDLGPGGPDAVELRTHPSGRVGDTDLEQDRDVGHQPLDRGEVQRQHPLEPEPAGDPLVGDRRIDVPVADHRCSPLERGADQLLDVLRTRGRVESGLRPRRHVAAVQQELADLLPERGAAGLAGEDDLRPLGLEPLAEEPRLRGLSGAVESFE